VRLEIGQREISSGKVTVFRRDTGERFSLKTHSLGQEIPELLSEAAIKNQQYPVLQNQPRPMQPESAPLIFAQSY
jgi:prolyl-tRNA synthetase